MSVLWIEATGGGHAVVAHRPEGGDEVGTACGYAVVPEEGTDREAPDLQARPFGADTCPTCHALLKLFNSGQMPTPDGLVIEDDTPAPRKMTAAERSASIRGAPAPDNAGVAPTDAPRPVKSKSGRKPEPGSNEDLGFEEPDPRAGIATSGDAVVVVPDSKPRRRRAAPVEVEDFSDIDSD